MESNRLKSNSKIKAILLIIGILGTVTLLSCVLLHITPVIIGNSILDFATHHYFLMGFISLTVAIVCWKMYISLDEKIDSRYQRNNLNNTRPQRKRNLMLNKLHDLYSKKKDDESQFIKPESLSKLKFTDDDVLKDEAERQQRQRDLQRATVLGNSFKQKVILRLKDYHSKKHLMTTVWHSNSEHISLKGGIVLPVKSIYKIEF